MPSLIAPLVFADKSVQVTAYPAKVPVTWLTTGALSGLWLGTVGAGNGVYTNGLPLTGGSRYTATKRTLYSNVVTTVNQILGQRNTEQIFHIGNSPDMGGFLFSARFGANVWANGGRLFAGLSVGTNTVVSSGNPSANNNTCGFCIDDSDTLTISFMSRNASATTKVSTGFSFAINTLYEVKMYCAPAGSQIDWSIKNLETGAEVIGVNTTNLPTADLMMTAGVLASNAALTTATAIQIGVNQIQISHNY